MYAAAQQKAVKYNIYVSSFFAIFAMLITLNDQQQ